MTETECDLIERAMAGIQIVPCPECRGVGEKLTGRCRECRGVGRVTTNELEVDHEHDC